MKNYVLYFNKPQHISVLEETIPTPKTDEVLIQNIISGISSGTEMLLYQGLMPTELFLDETISSLKHQMNYPLKYGYCAVGKVIETGNKKLNHLLNQWVFVFNPHESYFCANEQQIIVLPEYLSPYDALFIPNMETAINLVLDGCPLIGENVLILGLGIVGLLTTALLQQFPLTYLFGVDLYENRRRLAIKLGAKNTFDATQTDVHLQLSQYLKDSPIDLIYELTGNPEALNSAISLAAYEGRIVLGSWYGRKPCSINLGGRFHRNRINIIASQVSSIASKLQGRWTKARRLEVVFKMLKKIKPSQFISHKFHIAKANQAYHLLDSDPKNTLFITLTYEE